MWNGANNGQLWGRAKATNTFFTPLHSVGHNPLPFAALTFGTAWALLFRFSALFFVETSSVTVSSFVSVCITATLFAGVIFLHPLQNCMASSGGTITIIGGSALAAVLASALNLFESLEAPFCTSPLARALISGFLFGLGFLGCSCAALQAYKSLASGSALSIAAAGLTSGYALYLIVSACYPLLGGPGQTVTRFVVTMLPCLAATCWLAFVLPKRATPKAQVDKKIPNSTNALKGLSALVGFLVVFMPTMYPKTTNYAPGTLGENACLGLSSVRCIMALALCCGLLWVGVRLFKSSSDKHTGQPPVVAACAFGGISAFALIFFSLPSMSSNSIPFVLVTACSVPLLFAIVALLARQDIHEMCQGLVIMTGAGLMASVFSCAFLGPLYGAFPFQDTLFSIVPAIMLALVAFGGFCLWNSETRGNQAPGDKAAWHRATIAEKVTPLQSRCVQLRETCGLTQREAQVLELLAAGRNEPYIEQELGISRTTVKTHISHVYRKVGVSSRQQLIDVLHEVEVKK